MIVRLAVPQKFEGLVDDLLDMNVQTGRRSFPAVDVTEDEQKTVVVAELPGVRKEDIRVSFEDGKLAISGQRKPYEIPQSAKVLLNEIRIREFNRTIEPSHEVDADAIGAAMENGVLTVTLPKAERAKARTVSIR